MSPGKCEGDESLPVLRERLRVLTGRVDRLESFGTKVLWVVVGAVLLALVNLVVSGGQALAP